MRTKPIRLGLAAGTLIGGLASSGLAAGGVAHAATTTPPAIAALTYAFPTGSDGQLTWPMGISATNGNVYVSNSADNLVSLINSSGTTTLVGSLEAHGEKGDGGLASSATLTQPTQTTEDAAGNVYIADTEDNVIREVIASTGVITRVAGTGVAGARGLGGLAKRAQLNAPQGVAVNAKGDLFIADTYNNRVLEVLPFGTIVTFAGNGIGGYRGDRGPAARAELAQPTGLAFDAEGNLYIADSANSVIRRVDARTGVITTVAGNYAGEQANGGLGSFAGDGGPATSAQLYDPQGVALDGAGDLFIADTFNNAIREVTPSGTISTVVNAVDAPASGGETNGAASASHLNGPSAVAIDASTETLYIADTSNNKAEAVTGLAQAGTHAGPGSPEPHRVHPGH